MKMILKMNIENQNTKRIKIKVIWKVKEIKKKIVIIMKKRWSNH